MGRTLALAPSSSNLFCVSNTVVVANFEPRVRCDGSISRTKTVTIVSAVAELPGSVRGPSPETQPTRGNRPPCFG
eukprot:6009770-Prymnesium_polylepis.1